MNNWNEEAADNDFDFVGLEPVFPGRKQNGIPHPRGGRALCNGHAHSSHGALKSLDCLAPPGSGVASRLSPEPAQEEAAGAEEPRRLQRLHRAAGPAERLQRGRSAGSTQN